MNKSTLLILMSLGLSGCQNAPIFQAPLQISATLQESSKYQNCSIVPTLIRSAYNEDGLLKDFSIAYKETLQNLKTFYQNNEPLLGKEEAKADFISKLDKAIKEKAYKSKSEHVQLYNELGHCLKSRDKLSPELRTKINEVREHIANTYLPSEKKVFLTRTNGLKFCTNKLIRQFSMGRIQTMPTKQCMYYSEGNLKAAQITNDGILADSAYGEVYPGDGHYIMIRNPNDIDAGIADGQYLRPGYFSYEGLYQYRTLLFSTKTIHSFKRMNLTTDTLFKDIYFYNGY